MIKILVVEDSQDKLKRVLSELTAVDGCVLDDIDIARDARGAKQFLLENYYDLLILDISLPPTSDKDPVPDGGLVLLDEIIDRDIYISPREVIGLTAYSDIESQASKKFAGDLWRVLHYDISSTDWGEQIQRKVRHILATKKMGKIVGSYETDVCVITALPTPELSAVLNIPWAWGELPVDNDATQYHQCQVESHEKTLSVVAAAASRMGMPAAAVLAMKMITTFRPRYLVMLGITAGISGQVEMGDIIVADPSWDYGNGKRTLSDNVPIFYAAPHQINLEGFLKAKLARLSQDSGALAAIRSKWPTKCPPLLSVRLGPLASGAAVLEDPSITAGIREQHRKVLGIEMEAYAVFAAAQEASLPKPSVFVMKSVCDFADVDKDDSMQDYAAYTSAAAFKLFLEKFI
ncbi:histidine kinase [Pseudomonas sp. Boi14]|nr:histidine kinase [Pseudomonas sp. Boi14]